MDIGGGWRGFRIIHIHLVIRVLHEKALLYSLPLRCHIFCVRTLVAIKHHFVITVISLLHILCTCSRCLHNDVELGDHEICRRSAPILRHTEVHLLRYNLRPHIHKFSKWHQQGLDYQFHEAKERNKRKLTDSCTIHVRRLTLDHPIIA